VSILNVSPGTSVQALSFKRNNLQGYVPRKSSKKNEDFPALPQLNIGGTANGGTIPQFIYLQFSSIKRSR